MITRKSQRVHIKKLNQQPTLNPMWPYPTGGPALTLGTLELGFGNFTWAWQRHLA